jgi:hypothetical protein
VKLENAEERLARLEELLCDSTTDGLEQRETVELAELRHALGERGASASRAIEEAAALVFLATRASRADAMPMGLRRRLQQRSFEAFDRSPSASQPETPSTTTGANVVSLEESAAPARRRPHAMLWAAAAVLLLGVGFAAVTRGVARPDRAAPATAGVHAVTVNADESARKLVVRWQGGAPAGVGSLHLFLRDAAHATGWRGVGLVTPDGDDHSVATVSLSEVIALPASFRIAERDAVSGGPRTDAAHWEGEVSKAGTER